MMWTRKDFGILAATAIATFGLTVGTFWPRLANAIDDQPAPTTNVKTPTLTLGSVQVTAQRAKNSEHAIILTIKNTSAESASAAFKALAQITPPIGPISRGIPIARPAWTNDYSLNLQPGETQTLTVTLPDAAFNVPPTPAPDKRIPPEMRTVPGKSELVLADIAPATNTRSRNFIIALQLVGPPAAPPPAAASESPDAATAAPFQINNAVAHVSEIADNLRNPQARP